MHSKRRSSEAELIALAVTVYGCGGSAGACIATAHYDTAWKLVFVAMLGKIASVGERILLAMEGR